MLKRCVGTLIFSLIVFLGQSQKDCQSIGKMPFQKGEELHYALIYHWGLIWLHAGDVVFSVDDTLINNKKHFLFEGKGSSIKSWDWFYKVRSRYVAVADSQLHSKEFWRLGQEGNHMYNDHYVFTPSTINCSVTQEKGPNKQITLKNEACIFDVITAVYYCRSLNFKQLKVNQLIPFKIVLEGELHDSYIRYAGIKTWQKDEDSPVYECYVFKPYLIEGTVFSKGENMQVYFDRKKGVPVYVETDLVVGKAIVYLTNFTH